MTAPLATRFVALTPHTCAHSRFGQIGCTRCLDICPESALTSSGGPNGGPSGGHVALNPSLCQGCLGCVAVCPTGAMAPLEAAATPLAHLPPAAALEGRIALVHAGARNAALLDAVAEHAGGLPENAIRVPVPELGAVGVVFLLAALSRGARAVHLILTRGERGHLSGLEQAITIAGAACAGLGLGGARLALVEEDDPWVLAKRLRTLPMPEAGSGTRGRNGADAAVPPGAAGLRAVLAQLDRRAVPDPLPLPPGSPVGQVMVDAARCTLCQACARACPGGALVVGADVPRLGFVEDRCVQCGLCRAVCPENAVRLEPRWASAGADEPRLLKEDELVSCTACGATVGPRSALDRMAAVLAGHPMFQDPGALERLKLCERCR